MDLTQRTENESSSLASKMSQYLMASYLYYICDLQPPLSDAEFDQLGRYLLDHYDEISHPHKHLVTKEDFSAGTLFGLAREAYPLITRHAAIVWWREHFETSVD